MVWGGSWNEGLARREKDDAQQNQLKKLLEERGREQMYWNSKFIIIQIEEELCFELHAYDSMKESLVSTSIK